MKSVRVPQVDGLVTGARHDLAVVGREGNRQNVLRVAHKAARGFATLQVPQTQRAVPRARQGAVAIRGEGNVLYVVGVAEEQSRHTHTHTRVQHG
jgi:hypothetical protein